MPSRFEVNPRLDVEVAEKMLLPRVVQLQQAIAAQARLNAPDGKMWLCLHPDVRVAALDAEQVTRREHSGFLVQVTTMSGRAVSTTPDHLLWSQHGWVEVGDLRVGDVLHHVTGQEPDAGTPIGGYADQVLGEHPTSRFMLTAAHPHLSDHGGEVLVESAAVPDPDALRAGIPEVAGLVPQATTPTVRGVCTGCGGLRHPTAPGVVLTTDPVRTVELVTYSGPVYDLTTVGGWFTAGGLVVHNSMRDERVRPAHVHADGQTIPDNLRFVLRRDDTGKIELGRRPRDPALHISLRINCRCVSVPVPGVVGASIQALTPVIEGPRVTAEVETRFPRAAESEQGTSEDHAARFLGRAVDHVAALSRYGSARRT